MTILPMKCCDGFLGLDAAAEFMDATLTGLREDDDAALGGLRVSCCMNHPAVRHDHVSVSVTILNRYASSVGNLR